MSCRGFENMVVTVINGGPCVGAVIENHPPNEILSKFNLVFDDVPNLSELKCRIAMAPTLRLMVVGRNGCMGRSEWPRVGKCIISSII